MHLFPPPGPGHLAITARYPERVAEFYQELLDLPIVRQTSNPLIGDATLPSEDPSREDHQLAFLTNAKAQHIAFRVDSLDQLRTLYTGAKTRDWRFLRARRPNHGRLLRARSGGQRHLDLLGLHRPTQTSAHPAAAPTSSTS
jgi:catechol 2,3-dioxygenase-like lactoylglutathione lyase family enzyme